MAIRGYSKLLIYIYLFIYSFFHKFGIRDQVVIASRRYSHSQSVVRLEGGRTGHGDVDKGGGKKKQREYLKT